MECPRMDNRCRRRLTCIEWRIGSKPTGANRVVGAGRMALRRIHRLVLDIRRCPLHNDHVHDLRHGLRTVVHHPCLLPG